MTQNRRTVRSGVFYVVCSEDISIDRPSSVQLVQCSGVERVGWLVNELIRGWLQFSRCELLLLEAGS
jgi:hypothetical protein